MNLALNFEGFEHHLVKKDNVYDGVQYLFRFPNNYGASVIKHGGSYGHRQDLWELGVIKFDSERTDDWNLTYDTPITDDVIGYLDDIGVKNLLKEIMEL